MAHEGRPLREGRRELTGDVDEVPHKVIDVIHWDRFDLLWLPRFPHTPLRRQQQTKRDQRKQQH